MRYQRPEVVALLGLGAAALLAVVSLTRAHRAPAPVRIATPPAATLISVHVTGEVVWPGLYVLKAGSRLQEALFAARGPTILADLKRVNLAAVVRDGDRVVIPRIAQPPYPFAEALAEERARAIGGRRAGRPPGPPSASSQKAVPPAQGTAESRRSSDAAGEASAAVNVNTATVADLERLPGVGPVLARRIVEFREAKGLFRRLEDLQEVEGVGPKLYRRIQPLLRLD